MSGFQNPSQIWALLIARDRDSPLDAGCWSSLERAANYTRRGSPTATADAGGPEDSGRPADARRPPDRLTPVSVSGVPSLPLPPTHPQDPVGLCGPGHSCWANSSPHAHPAARPITIAARVLPLRSQQHAWPITTAYLPIAREQDRI